MDDRKPNNSSDFEEELAEATSDESQYAHNLNTARNAEKMQKQQEQASKLDQARDAAKSYVKDAAKKEVKAVAGKAAKRVAARAGAMAAQAAASAAAAAAPWIGTALAIIAGIVAVIIIFFMIIGYSCQRSDTIGWLTRVGSSVASSLGVIQFDICETFDIINGGSDLSVPEVSSESNLILVPIVGVPVSPSTSDPRLKSCMLAKVQSIWARAQLNDPPINFEITSAFRPNQYVAGTNRLSAHSKGEAVDIAIRPTGDLKDPAFQEKIRALIKISQEVDFKPPRGDTLDEYNKPTEGATGGHIHIEYNTPRDGSSSYCG